MTGDSGAPGRESPRAVEGERQTGTREAERQREDKGNGDRSQGQKGKCRAEATKLQPGGQIQQLPALANRFTRTRVWVLTELLLCYNT